MVLLVPLMQVVRGAGLCHGCCCCGRSVCNSEETMFLLVRPICPWLNRPCGSQHRYSDHPCLDHPCSQHAAQPRRFYEAPKSTSRLLRPWPRQTRSCTRCRSSWTSAASAVRRGPKNTSCPGSASARPTTRGSAFARRAQLLRLLRALCSGRCSGRSALCCVLTAGAFWTGLPDSEWKGKEVAK